MNDFEKQLKRAEELAKKHGSLVIPGADSEPSSNLKVIEYAKPVQNTVTVYGYMVIPVGASCGVVNDRGPNIQTNSRISNLPASEN